ncbi:MAG: hypothetical protein HYT61_03375 [Candidatus Yanofskybacteria bacterium]|nr:hypothetical protein [Candidatus Yanofskybacteria bacterium]
MEGLKIKFKKQWAIPAISLLLFLFPFSLARAATLFISPGSGTYNNGSNFSVSIRINSAGVSINAAVGILKFNPAELAVTSLTRTGSIFSLWVQEPDFSNALGTINFGGIVFNPGYTGTSGNILTINFKAKAVATTQVSFSSGAVLANDGQGTNVLSSLAGGAYVLRAISVLPKVTPVSPQASSQATPKIVTTPAPVSAEQLIITSSTHPDQLKWYSNNNPIFKWDLPVDTGEVILVLSRRNNSPPIISYDPPISEKVLDDVGEGEFYFNARAKTPAGLGPVTSFKFNVDTQKPADFKITRLDVADLTNPQPRLAFDTSDGTSGIDRYEMKIGESDWLKIEPGLAGLYKMPLQLPGVRKIIIRAFDKAGNYSESDYQMEIQSIEPVILNQIEKPQVKIGETITINGKAKPNQKVRVAIRVNPEYILETHADANGYWQVEFKPERGGRHEVTAQAVDDRSAISIDSNRVSFRVKSGSFTELIFDFLTKIFGGFINFIKNEWLLVSSILIIALIFVATKKEILATGHEVKSYLIKKYRKKKKLNKKSKTDWIHKKEMIEILLSILVFVIIMLFSNWLLGLWYSYSTDKQIIQLKTVFSEELKYISDQREEIVSSGVLNDALKAGDTLELLSIVQAEAKERELSFIAVTDKDGFVLVRSHLPDQRGDNVFQTTIQGRRVAKGETVTEIVRGVKNPLAAISNSLILEDDKVIGAIVLGNLFNNSYAVRFQDKYLKNGSHVIFYTPEEGLISTSLKDKDTIFILNSFFSVGSDLIAKQVPKFAKELKISEEYYIVSNIVFPGIEGSPGGTIILFPTSHNFYSIVLAGFMALAFLAIFIYLSFFLSVFHHRHRIPTILIITLTLFSVMYFISYNKLDRISIKLERAPYSIYNSTIKFEPEADIINQFVEKNIAIKVLTGGEIINVVSAVIKYDPSVFEIVDILTANSLCDPGLFLEKDIDNAAGTVTIVCGVPNPGFSEPSGTVAELVVQPLTVGGASLKFAEGTQVLANDGLGTDVLRAASDAFYSITRQGLTNASINEIIPIFSPSHPNSNRWYHKKDIQLAWPLLEGGVYHYALNQTPDFIPGKAVSTSDNFLNISIDEDSIYYFRLQAEDTDGRLGPVSQFKIMIDSTPPAPPVIKASSLSVKIGETVRFKFSVGFEEIVQPVVYFKIDDGIFFPVALELLVPFFESGKHKITARVFDLAGNFSDSSLEIQVTGGGGLKDKALDIFGNFWNFYK